MIGSGMPQMRAAFKGWMQSITLDKRSQSVDADGLVSYSDKPISFKGTIQPLNPREIALKPEGQRAWEWLQVHVMASNGSILKPDDQIIYNCKKYKVMGQNDYSLNGYIEYHLVRDYQP